MPRALIIGGGIVFVGVFVLFGMQKEAAAPAIPTVSDEASHSTLPTVSTLFVNDIAISVELALTDEERARGLGGREVLPQNTGMLFVFPYSAPHGIWMDGMRFPIDIIWLTAAPQGVECGQGGERGKCLVVIDIKEYAAPESYPEVFQPGAKALYVLELNAGIAKENGIQPGAVVALKRP